MNIAVYFIVALAAYFISGLNPAIILSKAIYHEDIRKSGSGNPGFTNFARVFGHKYAWLVFVLDIGKGALISVAAGTLFSYYCGSRTLGVAYAGTFALLGHAYPVMYRFRGGKGFLVCLSTLWFIHPGAGAIGTAVLVVALLTTKYMSLSTLGALIVGAIFVVVFGGTTAVCLMYAGCVLFVIVRHRGNIARLMRGDEPKFSFGHKKVEVYQWKT